MKSTIRYTGTGTFPSQKLTSLNEHLWKKQTIKEHFQMLVMYD